MARIAQRGAFPVLRVPGRWVWDFWTADDAERYHLFYLEAPTSLTDPRRRHRAARIGHVVSTDLVRWSAVGRPFEAGPGGSFDQTATWTGCVVRGDDGLWRMFYTGARFLENEPGVAHTEGVGVATSSDLERWKKRPGAVSIADPRWYETIDDAASGQESWRDPWVIKDPSGDGWHMFVTARANTGARDDRGVIGHAVSADLETWEARPPLSKPGAGFVHLEVPQMVLVEGQWFLLFSCATEALSATQRRRHDDVGTWAVPVDSPTGPFDVAAARPVTTSSLYSCRVLQDRSGRWVLLGFHNGPEEDSPGAISDPLPLLIGPDGYPRPVTAPRQPVSPPTRSAPEGGVSPAAPAVPLRGGADTAPAVTPDE